MSKSKIKGRSLFIKIIALILIVYCTWFASERFTIWNIDSYREIKIRDCNPEVLNSLMIKIVKKAKDRKLLIETLNFIYKNKELMIEKITTLSDEEKYQLSITMDFYLSVDPSKDYEDFFQIFSLPAPDYSK